MISILPIKKIDSEIVKDINALLPQLSSRAKKVSAADLRRVIDPKNGTLFAVRDGKKIIGMGTIVLMRIPMFLCAWMEDVVIDKEYRNRGLGSALVKKLIICARAKHAKHLNFTSRHNRKEANRWYLKMGFIKREANVYRISL